MRILARNSILGQADFCKAFEKHPFKTGKRFVGPHPAGAATQTLRILCCKGLLINYSL